ncbi:hypothetical protein [Neorhizobium sp. JUb45]|uniref:hypothetical protein n=1 Tax=Neorhizobium sp. JUb45 TaxID=2485113 RepID=UPI00104B5684|nr:hypothetical protein [Neorhizobium sp. JUb45]
MASVGEINVFMAMPAAASEWLHFNFIVAALLLGIPNPKFTDIALRNQLSGNGAFERRFQHRQHCGVSETVRRRCPFGSSEEVKS